MKNDKSTLFFAHANGFPSKTYRKFFSYLADDFNIESIDNSGHDGGYPPDDNWQHLALELQHQIERNFTQPIIGLGHSLGGALHLIVALNKPELYQQLIILDSPLYGPIKSRLLKLYKKLDWMHKITPSKSSARRRDFWPNAQAASEYFQEKSLYKNFDPECLQDYITFGTKAVTGGIQLLVKPTLEGEIFAHLPDNIAWRKPTIPATFVYAKNSHVITKADLAHLKRKFSLFEVSGGHLFPFEQPEKTANIVREIIALKR
jgi:pimeloyl-ACP methyl ester carboxylesterase